jgi:hypothetical protein
MSSMCRRWSLRLIKHAIVQLLQQHGMPVAMYAAAAAASAASTCCKQVEAAEAAAAAAHIHCYRP